MARFTCRTLTEGSFVAVDQPSTSSSSSKHTKKCTPKASSSSKTTRQRAPRDTKLKGTKREEKLAKVVESKKKQQVKTRVEEKRVTLPQTFVYVGNLDTSVDHRKLVHLFLRHKCGQIKQVVMRTSRGQAVQPGVAIPNQIKTKRDGQYASVSFFDSESVERALRLNGILWEGNPLVVTLSALDLPECQDIIERHAKGLGATPPLIRGDTERVQEGWNEVAETKPDADNRHRFMGWSFAKALML